MQFVMGPHRSDTPLTGQVRPADYVHGKNFEADVRFLACHGWRVTRADDRYQRTYGKGMKAEERYAGYAAGTLILEMNHGHWWIQWSVKHESGDIWLDAAIRVGGPNGAHSPAADGHDLPDDVESMVFEANWFQTLLHRLCFTCAPTLWEGDYVSIEESKHVECDCEIWPTIIHNVWKSEYVTAE